MSRLKKVFADTKDVFATRWNTQDLRIPPWIVSALIFITAARSLSYGIELLFVVTSNPISQLMAFAAIFGIQLWGILMLGAIVVFLIGILTRRSLIVTIGTLLSAAVWTAFALTMGFGIMDVGSGYRFFVAASATAGTWALFFWAQLKSLRINGVGRTRE